MGSFTGLITQQNVSPKLTHSHAWVNAGLFKRKNREATLATLESPELHTALISYLPALLLILTFLYPKCHPFHFCREEANDHLSVTIVHSFLKTS